MPKFDINKLRSAGLRYLVADANGQIWAFELMPVCKEAHWRLNDKHLCPSHYGEEYKTYWNNVANWRLKGRAFCRPIYDAPIKLALDDDPYDIVKNGLVTEQDFKVWPDASL